MRNLMAMALCLFALPAVAGDNPLWGTWKITNTIDRSFSGVMIVDRDGRATWDSTWDVKYRRANNITPVGIGSAKSLGYVRDLGNEKLDIVLTNRDVVKHTHCTPQSREMLQCDEGGQTVLVRIGPGPVSLMPVSR